MRFGWIPDIPDRRDVYLSAGPKRKLPAKYDMRPNCPPVYNQYSLGSCTAQSVAAALQFTMLEKAKSAFIPSRLFIYYNARVLHRTVKEDSGASLRNAIKAVVKNGFCDEKLWPHVLKDFAKRPSPSVFKSAVKRKLHDPHYARVEQSLYALKKALSENNPIVFGFSVYDSFDQIGRDGLMPMPGFFESSQGGHAVTLVGYDDEKKNFIVRNSWGTAWGDQGYFYMPYDFAVNPDYCADFWVLKGVP